MEHVCIGTSRDRNCLLLGGTSGVRTMAACCACTVAVIIVNGLEKDRECVSICDDLIVES